MERDHIPEEEKLKPQPQPTDKIKQFECKVCLEIANEPVVTQCGHLFWYDSITELEVYL